MTRKIIGKLSPCPKYKGLCEIQVYDTLAPEPKNIGIGCVIHGFHLPELFCSVDEAIDAWNRRMKCGAKMDGDKE